MAAPLFAIEPMVWDPPDPVDFDGILAGSANAFRQGGSGLAGLTKLPVLAVGERTALEARRVGFDIEAIGAGGLQGLVDSLESHRRILRLCGEKRVDLTPPFGVAIVERIVYRASLLPLSPQAVETIGAGAVVLLHSGEAARHFTAECERLSIERARVKIAALAPRIAGAVGRGWQTVRVAPEVTDAALLAMTADMCH